MTEKQGATMDVSMIRRPQDWPFPIPQITTESIDELIDALHRDVSDSTLSIYYDAVDGCSREMENEDQEMMVREYYLHDGWAAKHGTGA
ncbi:hypothetical protein [Bifidobacterium longum]|nr:hypothetical protein [Bifidobacterium longum]